MQMSKKQEGKENRRDLDKGIFCFMGSKEPVKKAVACATEMW